MRLRRREASLGEFEVGRAAVALKVVEDAQVDAVEFEFGNPVSYLSSVDEILSLKLGFARTPDGKQFCARNSTILARATRPHRRARRLFTPLRSRHARNRHGRPVRQPDGLDGLRVRRVRLADARNAGAAVREDGLRSSRSTAPRTSCCTARATSTSSSTAAQTPGRLLRRGTRAERLRAGVSRQGLAPRLRPCARARRAAGGRPPARWNSSSRRSRASAARRCT